MVRRMSDRLSSLLILSGGVLVFLVVWGMSVVIVRRDMRRRGAGTRERRVWTAAAVVLPLVGFALYLFYYVLRGYFTPAAAGAAGTQVAPEDRAPSSENGEDDTREVVFLPATGGSKMHEAAPASELEFTPATMPVARRAVSGRYALFVAQGPHKGQTFELAPLPQRIGRGPEASIPLDADLNVSRSHAEVYEWMGLLRIRDLGSTHGTLINGVPVSDQAFNLGDHVSVGGTQLVLRELPTGEA